MNNTLKALTKSQQHKSAVIKDSSGNILTENTAFVNRWTEYCSDLYNYELHPDTSLLQSNQTPTQEVEEAVHNPTAGKSPGVDNIPSELLNNGDEATTVLTALCQKIWETKDTIFCHTFTKERQLSDHQLISHSSRIMLQVILNRLKTKAEEMLAEEQTGFRPGWSTADLQSS